MEWPDIAKTYDTVAEDYATAFADELLAKPYDRRLLDRYAMSVAGKGPVWDIGCGAAAHVTRYLSDRGVQAVGVDVSARSIDVARSRQPELTFQVADMRALPTPDDSLVGVVAFYSLIHLQRSELPTALAELHRVMTPGGHLLLATHAGVGIETSDETIVTEQWFGHDVSVAATLVTSEEITRLVIAAGFSVDDTSVRSPYPDEYPTQRIYLQATARMTT